jgi:hypothetical protein
MARTAATARTPKSTPVAPTVPNVPAAQHGQGVTVEVRDGRAILSFPLDGDYGPSSTGKTIVVAKAGYSERIKVGDVTIQVMGYRKA